MFSHATTIINERSPTLAHTPASRRQGGNIYGRTSRKMDDITRYRIVKGLCSTTSPSTTTARRMACWTDNLEPICLLEWTVQASAPTRTRPTALPRRYVRCSITFYFAATSAGDVGYRLDRITPPSRRLTSDSTAAVRSDVGPIVAVIMLA